MNFHDLVREHSILAVGTGVSVVQNASMGETIALLQGLYLCTQIIRNYILMKKDGKK